MDEIRIINSIEEITEFDVKYAHISKPHRWIRVDKDGEQEFCVYGMVSGDQSTAITTSNWNKVKIWKTFNGVMRALKNYIKIGSWGMKHWE